jgi:hypothetical protein
MKITDDISKLTKNPLGIIALFILLNYSIASLVFGIVNTNITENQRWIFIIFIILFPIIVLFVFYKLVTKYHTHLYSPGEYKDEANFIGMTNKKLEREIEVKEIVEIEKINNIEPNQKNKDKKIMNQYEKAEKLVLEKLAKERNVKVCRDLRLNRDYGFDGMLEGNNTIIYVEVKYIRRSFIPFTILENINYRAKSIINATHNVLGKNRDVKFILVFVIDSNDIDIDPLKEKINNYTKVITDNYLEILIYRMNDLE